MSVIVLLVEDMPEQQEIAKRELVANGFRPAVAGNLHDALSILHRLKGKIACILTDIEMPETEIQKEVLKPCGLAIVAKAVQAGLPVVVCSDANHHHVLFATEVFDVLRTHKNFTHIGEIPFVMDRKDWVRAVSELKRVYKKIEEKK